MGRRGGHLSEATKAKISASLKARHRRNASVSSSKHSDLVSSHIKSAHGFITQSNASSRRGNHRAAAKHLKQSDMHMALAQLHNHAAKRASRQEAPTLGFDKTHAEKQASVRKAAVKRSPIHPSRAHDSAHVKSALPSPGSPTKPRKTGAGSTTAAKPKRELSEAQKAAKRERARRRRAAKK